MLAALQAGLAYFAAVFAVSFALGTVRVLLLIPNLGESTAVLLELPIMLGVSWVACGFFVARFSVPALWIDRLVMGALAFLLLTIAEGCLSVLLFGRSVAEHLATYRSGQALMGLAAQIAYAAFPLLRIGRR